MMRFVMVALSLACCFSLVGCGSETHEGLINTTIQAMDLAGTEVDGVKKKVVDAVKKVEGGAPKLDLTDAMKATEGLKKVGEEFQKIKQKVEQVRTNLSDEDKKNNADKQKGKLNDAFKSLLDRRDQLRKALEQAETMNGGAFKANVAELRKKIDEAQGPFFSLARQ